MEVIETVREMRKFRRDVKGKTALVATLGGMHAGHEAHLAKASQIADVTLGSLFLNPTQFSASEDLGTYPQNRDEDLAMFGRYETTAVFAPSPEEMYPPGDTFKVDPGPIADLLEGKHRPGHFVGVATVVAKLFAIFQPDVATFGEKDAQQLKIIEKLNRELHFGVEIVPIPTVRESDGLAMSSRNRYLSLEERTVAPTLYRALVAGRDMWKGGERNAERIRSHVSDLLAEEPLLRPDYVSVADSETLEELYGPVTGPVLLSLASLLGKARLIDNVLLG